MNPGPQPRSLFLRTRDGVAERALARWALTALLATGFSAWATDTAERPDGSVRALPASLGPSSSQAPGPSQAARPRMLFGDPTRHGRPFAKDPCVLRLGERYLLYYSMAPSTNAAVPRGWAIGIAESRDLIEWRKVGEILPEQECERNGLVNGKVLRLGGKVHLFYNTYGNGRNDALCHAVSEDGLSFTRNSSNPILHPTGAWNSGRAIDCDAFEFGGKLWLIYATRDPSMQTQMLVAATADLGSGFGRDAWTPVSDGPILEPELPWETRCIEAPSVIQRGDTLYLFYGGGYNNDPQQIGCATSRDGVRWTRLFREPLIPNGRPGDWNSSETGHPGVFADTDGRTYLFVQGNKDHGRTWFLSAYEIGWQDGIPVVMWDSPRFPMRASARPTPSVQFPGTAPTILGARSGDGGDSGVDPARSIVAITPPEGGFYAKRLDYEGIPIKAPTDVVDEALVAAYGRLSMMLSNLPSVRAKLRTAGAELHIIGRDQVTTDLPEWRHDKGKPLEEYHGLTRDQRTRGMGGLLTSCGEENLLRLEKDRYRGRDICVHEFAHNILDHGVSRDVRAKVREQYRRSLDRGLWEGSYAGSNVNEFFAELAMWYFGTRGDLGMQGPKPANGPDGLKAYDPEAFALLDEFYRGRMEPGEASRPTPDEPR